MRFLALAAIVCAAACGGSELNPGGIPGSSCSVTLSGAQTGTYSCTPALAFNSSNNQWAWGFSIPSTSTSPVVSAALGGSGQPATGTYASTTSGVQGASTVQQGSSSSAVWEATNGSSGQGSFSLTITSLGSSITANGGTAYPSAHGTFTASMPAAPGSSATGTVTANVTF